MKVMTPRVIEKVKLYHDDSFVGADAALLIRRFGIGYMCGYN